MTNKIPVGATIARTYGFAFGNFINNLAATWIPQAVMLAAGFVIAPLATPALLRMRQLPPGYAAGAQNVAAATAAMQNNLRNLGPILPFLALIWCITFICLSAVAAGLTKEALSPAGERSFRQFPFGAPTWRLAAAFLLTLLVLVGLYLATIVVGVIGAVLAGVLAANAGAAGKAVVGIVTVVIGLIAFCAIIYAWVRLSFLVTPSVVAEQRITLVHGWRLTRGNFWRIVATGLVVLLPLIALLAIFVGALLGGTPPSHPGVTPAEIAAWSQQVNQRALGLSESYRRFWYVTYPIMVVVNTVLYGMICGLSAFAYRALVPEPNKQAAEFG
jgi:hypothetical protein